MFPHEKAREKDKGKPMHAGKNVSCFMNQNKTFQSKILIDQSSKVELFRYKQLARKLENII